MKDAKEVRMISNEINDSSLKQIESLINDFANRGNYQITWHGFISEDVKAELEVFGYSIIKRSSNMHIISRRKLKSDKSN